MAMKDRYSVSEDGKHLIIYSADIDDTARFTCQAENIAGQTEKNIDVDVLGMCVVIKVLKVLTDLTSIDALV